MKTFLESAALVGVESANIDRYKRNFLQQAVCELRFPTIMEFGEPKPPAFLVNALRKEYPYLELANEVTLGIGNSSSGSNSHIFRAAKMNWSVSLKQSSISIETSTYTSYAQFKERILRVADAAVQIIDSDFFTRVGMRYINIVDKFEKPSDNWINPDLIAPLRTGHFTGILEYAGKMQLTNEDGGCLLQHGIQLRPKKAGEETKADYVIDIDSFHNQVEINDLSASLDALHTQSFNLFDWSLGTASREYLAAN